MDRGNEISRESIGDQGGCRSLDHSPEEAQRSENDWQQRSAESKISRNTEERNEPSKHDQHGNDVPPDKFVLVLPSRGKEPGHYTTDRISQSLESKSDHHPFQLLPRPRSLTWESLTCSTMQVNNGDMSKPSSDFTQSKINESLDSLQDHETHESSSLHSMDPYSRSSQNQIELPTLEFSKLRHSTLLPDFTQLGIDDASVSDTPPRLNLLQRREQRSNPFSIATMAREFGVATSGSESHDRNKASSISAYFTEEWHSRKLPLPDSTIHSSPFMKRRNPLSHHPADNDLVLNESHPYVGSCYETPTISDIPNLEKSNIASSPKSSTGLHSDTTTYTAGSNTKNYGHSPPTRQRES